MHQQRARTSAHASKRDTSRVKLQNCVVVICVFYSRLQVAAVHMSCDSVCVVYRSCPLCTKPYTRRSVDAHTLRSVTKLLHVETMFLTLIRRIALHVWQRAAPMPTSDILVQESEACYCCCYCATVLRNSTTNTCCFNCCYCCYALLLLLLATRASTLAIIKLSGRLSCTLSLCRSRRLSGSRNSPARESARRSRDRRFGLAAAFPLA
jgi:hypothetical protein